jgi:hypothetical protein
MLAVFSFDGAAEGALSVQDEVLERWNAPDVLVDSRMTKLIRKLG